MKAWLGLFLDYLRTSFWFVPGCMAIGAIVAAVVLLEIDRRNLITFSGPLAWLGQSNPDAIRTLLSTLVGATITALSIVFSVTIVALTMAVQQLGPRLLRNFMRDRGTQIVLGIFVGTALYCILVLAMAGWVASSRMPQIATLGALALAIASVGVLIYFVHHVSEMIQAPNVIMTVARELERVIDEATSPRDGDGRHDDPGDVDVADRAEPPRPSGQSHVIAAPRSAYVQGLDTGRLMKLAHRHDLVLRVVRRPGRFVIRGQMLLEVWPAEKVDGRLQEQILDAFVLGIRRTPKQDVEFAVDELVEVALRALSPSLNDPFTAMNCIDRLGAAVSMLAQRRMPEPVLYDRDRRLRLFLDTSTFRGVVDAAFDQIRQSSRDHPAVTMRLLETLAIAGQHARTAAQRQALWRQAEMAHRQAVAATPEPGDRADIERRFREVQAVLR